MSAVQQGIKPGQSQTFYGPSIILFVLVGLLFGILFKEINKKFGIPYTSLLIFLGIILGNFHQSLGQWGRAIFNIQSIHPHTGMSIFVPTLVFTGALGTNFYMFRRSLVNILLISVPGVILGTLLLGFVFKYILGYDDSQMTWIQSFVLACSITSTDPVALVALLKEFGSTARFNTLIQGQSMVSGAFSMILYYLLVDVMNGEINNPLSFTFEAIRLTGGGMLLGLLFGFLVATWMKRIIKDHSLSIIITIIGSYLSFYLSEFTWLKFGGVAAVVTQGLYLAASVKRKIYPQSQQALSTVWSTMAHCAQTTLFILIGSIHGIEFIKYNTITTVDWIKLFAFWALMIVVRAIVIYAFLPIIKNRGYGLSRQQITVLVYGGLKGGLGLSLAMMITNDPFYPARFRHLCTFYMEGMVLMTVLINGVTCKKVVEWVEMIHVPEIKIKLLNKCIKEVLKQTHHKYKELKVEPELSHAKWVEVQRLAGLNKLGQVERIREVSAYQSEIRNSYKDMHVEAITQEIRFRFTRYLSKVYWNLYKQGQLSQEGIKTLEEICDTANDNSKLKLAYFEYMTEALSLDTVHVYSSLKDTPIIGPFFTRILVSKIYTLYEIGIVFVEACEQTIRVFKVDFPMHNELLNEVMEEAKQNIDLVFAYIGQLQNSFLAVIKEVHTRRAATIVLRHKRNNLRKMFEEGFVDENQYNVLRKEVDQNLLRVNFGQPHFENLNINETLLNYPLFQSLSNPQIDAIRSKAVERTFPKGSIILDTDAEFNSVQIILSGSVRQEFDGFYLIKNTGSVIDSYDLTLKKNSRCKAKALNNVTVMQLKPEIIDHLLATNLEFKQKWYKTLFIYESHLNINLDFLHKSLSDKHFRRFVEAAEVRFLKSGEKEYSGCGCYLFQGQVKSEGKTYNQEEGLIPKEKVLQVTKNSVIVKFGNVDIAVMQALRVSNYHADEIMEERLNPNSSVL